MGLERVALAMVTDVVQTRSRLPSLLQLVKEASRLVCFCSSFKARSHLAWKLVPSVRSSPDPIIFSSRKKQLSFFSDENLFVTG